MEINLEKKNYKTKFNIENIKKNNTLVIKYIAKNTLSYDFILVSVIAPFTETRKFAKKNLEKDILKYMSIVR